MEQNHKEIIKELTTSIGARIIDVWLILQFIGLFTAYFEAKICI